MFFDILAKVLTVIAVGLFLEYLTTAALRAKPTIDPATGARTFQLWSSEQSSIASQSHFAGFLWSDISCLLSRRGIRLSDLAHRLFDLCCDERFRNIGILCCTSDSVGRRNHKPLPMTGERFFGWDEIELFSYSKISGSFVVIGPYRRKIYASKYLNGFKYLTAEFRNRIPPDKWKYNYKESLSFS